MERSSVAIIGAGFSGSLLALQLLRHSRPSTTIRLIGQSPEFGPGVAYATTCSDALLNVPAGRMSAFPDQPLHFLEWLTRQPERLLNGLAPVASSFVPRRLYGVYLRSLLADAVRACPGRLELMRGEVSGVTRCPGGFSVQFEDGAAIVSAVAVVATGNSHPAPPFPGLALSPFYRDNPWAHDVAEDLAPNSAVLLVGTGLTMIDTVLMLLRRGHRGPIHALSRRGLLPCAHARIASPPPGFETRDIPRRLRDLVRFVRVECERIAETGGSWHAVIDALRPVTQDIWKGLSAPERRQFLAHVRPWWDVYRHRLAPAIAERIEAARASGQLRVHTGRISGFAPDGDAAVISWRPRATGAVATETLRAHRLINCCGPATDVTKSSDRLVRSLLAGGLARPDPFGLGFDLADDGAFRGNASDRLFGVGPVCRAALWENTAVPDIRVQCEVLARRISALADPRDADHPARAPLAAGALRSAILHLTALPLEALA